MVQNIKNNYFCNVDSKIFLHNFSTYYPRKLTTQLEYKNETRFHP